jgi:hypothetical protein
MSPPRCLRPVTSYCGMYVEGLCVGRSSTSMSSGISLRRPELKSRHLCEGGEGGGG